MSSREPPPTEDESFRHIVEDLEEYAIFIVDLEGRIASWNGGARRMKGYEDSEAIGMPFARLFTAEDVAAGRPAYEMQRALEEGVYRGKGTRVRKDASTFEAEVTLRRISAPDGRPRGFVKVTRDVTNRNRAAALEQHANQVQTAQRDANEKLVVTAIREQELTEQAEAARVRAESSEKELLDVAELREMFIGILGHDLRNPLSAITTGAGILLQRGRLDDSDDRTVARIITASRRMAKMVTQLLDLTRARLGGGLLLKVRASDLREICRSVLDEFEPGRARFEAEGDVTGVWDPDRLAQVVSNIVGNGIEHAAPGTMVAVKAFADGQAVVTEISNQGPPIPAEVLPFIFRPFRRAGDRVPSKSGNIGLGLFIAHEIVVAHGGTLEARSLGGTTTFVIRLPRRAPTGGG